MVEGHDIKRNKWWNLPEMNVKRCAGGACVVNHVAYVFCGEDSVNYLNSIEKLSLLNIEDRT